MGKFVCAQDAKNAAAAAFIRLQEYSLADFVAKIQDLVQQGYVFDFKSNESYPVQIGNMFAAGLFIKEPVAEVLQVVPAEQTAQAVQAVADEPEVKQSARRGRK